MGQILWPQWESVILSARPCPAGYPTDSVTVGSFSFITVCWAFHSSSYPGRSSFSRWNPRFLAGFLRPPLDRHGASHGGAHHLDLRPRLGGIGLWFNLRRSSARHSGPARASWDLSGRQLKVSRAARIGQLGLGERRPPSERKHAALGAQESGVCNRLVIGDLQFQRRIGLDVPGPAFHSARGRTNAYSFDGSLGLLRELQAPAPS